MLVFEMKMGKVATVRCRVVGLGAVPRPSILLVAIYMLFFGMK